MEAVRGRAPMIFDKERDVEEDIRHADCELNHEDTCKWTFTRWKWAISLTNCAKPLMTTHKFDHNGLCLPFGHPGAVQKRRRLKPKA